MNIVSLRAEYFEQAGQIATGSPNFCTNCHSCLNIYSSKNITFNQNEAKWICEFCSNQNILQIDQEEIPKNEVVTYILASENPKVEEIKASPISNDDPTIIFCIDLSGSMDCTIPNPGGKITNNIMAGILKNPQYFSRLECVKIAILGQLSNLAKNVPNAKVGFVAFGNEVLIYGDKASLEKEDIISGNILDNYETLIEKAAPFAKTHFNSSITKILPALQNTVKLMSTNGCTALGPALCVSTSIASKGSPGSKVIICTDGLANVGIGSVEGQASQNSQIAKSFYSKLGDYAKHSGVVISIITIASSECRLDLLSPTVNLTNGDIIKVSPLDLDKNFAEILSEKLIATNAAVEVHLQKAFMFTNEEETALKSEKSVMVKEIGNATKDTIITFEYDIKDSNELKNQNIDKEQIKEIIFQAQISFTGMDKKKCIRSITKRQEIATDIEEFKKNIKNNEIINEHAHQQAFKFAAKGDMLGAQKQVAQISQNFEGQFNPQQMNEINELNNDFSEEIQVNKGKDIRSDKMETRLNKMKKNKK